MARKKDKIMMQKCKEKAQIICDYYFNEIMGVSSMWLMTSFIAMENKMTVLNLVGRLLLCDVSPSNIYLKLDEIDDELLENMKKEFANEMKKEQKVIKTFFLSIE